MRLTAITERLAGLGGGKWEVHAKHGKWPQPARTWWK